MVLVLCVPVVAHTGPKQVVREEGRFGVRNR